LLGESVRRIQPAIRREQIGVESVLSERPFFQSVGANPLAPSGAQREFGARGWRAGKLRGLRFLPLLVAAGAVIVPGAAESQDRPSILLLPVVVHSSESPGYLRRGLSDMLMARFQQADQFELIEIDDPALATTRLEEAVEAGRSVGADFVLFGSFTRFGEGASLDMHAASTSVGDGEPGLREIFVHSGQIGEVIPDLDDLVGKVTRFAIDDFIPASPEAGESASPARPSPSVAELQRRIEKLERALEGLSSDTGGAP